MTHNGRGHYTEPFLVAVEEILDDGFFKVCRCGIPRRMSTVKGAHVHKGNHLQRRENVLLNDDRRDAMAYKRMLLSIMELFREGLHEPLRRTMGNYLEAIDGKYKESWLEE